MKRRLFGLIAATASIALTIALVEALLRMFWSPPSMLSDRPFGGHRWYSMAPLPGVSGRIVKWEYEHPFVHNQQRMRGDKNFTRERPAEFQSRILFLGDSFTYGLGSGDREIFPELVNMRLPDVEVINSGCNAYGQREELAVLDILGEALRPDLAILMFFWNDLEDNWMRKRPAYQIADSGKVIRVSGSLTAVEAYDPLALQEAVDLEKLRDNAFYTERLLAEGLKSLRYKLIGIKRRDIRKTEDSEAAWAVTDEYLKMLRMRCEEINTEFLVISIPDHNRVDPSASIRDIEPINFEIEEKLAEICSDLGIHYLDLTEAMKEAYAKSGQPLYYYADRHLTPIGNVAVADGMMPVIADILEGALNNAPRSNPAGPTPR